MQTRKVVINTCFGGFGLSDEAIAMFRMRKGIAANERTTYADELARDDYDLVYVVETLGEKANTSYSQLKVVEIPADVEWQIEEYDGSEHIAEQHRIWC
jgi:hypothetical protein